MPTNGAITTTVRLHPDGTETLTIRISRGFHSEITDFIAGLSQAAPGSLPRNIAHDLADRRLEAAGGTPRTFSD